MRLGEPCHRLPCPAPPTYRTGARATAPATPRPQQAYVVHPTVATQRASVRHAPGMGRVGHFRSRAEPTVQALVPL
jgi:hypothetical protein